MLSTILSWETFGAVCGCKNDFWGGVTAWGAFSSFTRACWAPFSVVGFGSPVALQNWARASFDSNVSLDEDPLPLNMPKR